MPPSDPSQPSTDLDAVRSADARSDEHLLAESRAGSVVAVEALLTRHLPGLRAFVRLRVGPELRAVESASDLVQSVCLDLVRDLDEFEYRGEGQFRRWLYTAALNKIRNHRRRDSAQKRGGDARRVGLEDDAVLQVSYQALCSPSHVVVLREQVEQLEQAFDALPEHYREVLTLSRIAGLTQEQIATEMGRTVPSVRNLLNRALAKLSAALVSTDSTS